MKSTLLWVLLLVVLTSCNSTIVDLWPPVQQPGYDVQEYDLRPVSAHPVPGDSAWLYIRVLPNFTGPGSFQFHTQDIRVLPFEPQASIYEQTILFHADSGKVILDSVLMKCAAYGASNIIIGCMVDSLWAAQNPVPPLYSPTVSFELSFTSNRFDVIR